jgi:thiol-disulfide isomerase/thioredoxin
MAGRIRAVRERTPVVRAVGGVVMLATAAVIALNVAEPLQRITPTWLSGLTGRIEAGAQAELDALAGGGRAMTFDDCAATPAGLQDCGAAPELTGVTAWLNSEPLTLDALRGKVVLVDFWTYSCINCQRTLPYLTRWHDEYADDGLVILGVHSPEFAFERVEGNVRDNAARLGVRYPVALDNDFATWRAYHQRFWPAHYLVDQEGTVRQVHYGEGAYDETEALIRDLLGIGGTAAGSTERESTPGRSPETYLGAARLGAIVNDPVITGRPNPFAAPAGLPRDAFALDGTWTIDDEYARAGEDARLAYRFYAAQVHLVLGGEGTVEVGLDGDAGYSRTVQVTGSPTLYTLYDEAARDDVLRLTLSAGVQAYAFTFG